MKWFFGLLRKAMGLPPLAERDPEGTVDSIQALDPTHPLYKYQLRIPERYLEQGWRIVDLDSLIGTESFRAYLRRPGHDELIESDDWYPTTGGAVENAIERLMEVHPLPFRIGSDDR